MQLNELKYNNEGLIPIIVQNIEDGQILMLAYGNKLTIERSIETKQAYYWSRSRNKIWMKGEESGNTQELVDIFYDCDSDVLLYIVKQRGPACHTNNKTCFYRKLDGNDGFSPEFNGNAITNKVYEVIEDRKLKSKKDSYVSSLFAKGIDKIVKKIGEEAGEVIIAAKNKDKGELIYEITDLWFHLLITMSFFDIKPEAINIELEKRFGKSKEVYGRD